MSLEDEVNQKPIEREQTPKPTYKELINAYKLLCKGAKTDRVYPLLGMTKAEELYEALHESGIYEKYGTVRDNRRKNDVHPTRREYSEARVKAAEELIKGGMTVKAACEEMGIRYGNWYKWKQAGLIKSYGELTGKKQDKYERSYRRYMADPTLKKEDVARIYGLNKDYMRIKWNRMGLSTAARKRLRQPQTQIDDKLLKECWIMYASGAPTKKIAIKCGCAVTTLRGKWIKAGYPYTEYARMRWEKQNGKGTYDKWVERMAKSKNESSNPDRQCGK